MVAKIVKFYDMQSKNQKNISPIKSRILQYIEYLGITKEKFCKSVLIESSNMRSANLKSEFSADKIGKILSCYPQLNPDWLINGCGPMERMDFTKEDENSTSLEVNAIVKEPAAKYNSDGISDLVSAINRLADAVSKLEEKL